MKKPMTFAAVSAVMVLGMTGCDPGADPSAGDESDTASASTPSSPESATATAESEPPVNEPQTYTLTFRVTGPGTAGVSVNSGGQEIVQLPWEATADHELTVSNSATVTAASLEDTALTCEVIHEGEVVAEETGTSTCSARFTPSGE